MAELPTRERILREARTLFAERGFTATSIRTIEERAGLVPGRGSLYRHFPSKEALLEAIVERIVEETRAYREAHEATAPGSRREGPASDPRGDLTRQYRAALAHLADLRDLIGLLGRSPDLAPELLDRVRSALVEEALTLGRSGLNRAIESGAIPRHEDPQSVAAIALFAVVGYALAELFFDLPLPIDQDRFTRALASLVVDHAPRGRSAR